LIGCGYCGSSLFADLPDPVASFPDRPSIVRAEYSAALDQVVVITSQGVEARDPATGDLIRQITDFAAPITSHDGSSDVSEDGQFWAFIDRLGTNYSGFIDRLIIGRMDTGEILLDLELSLKNTYNLTFSADSTKIYASALASSAGVPDAGYDDSSAESYRIDPTGAYLLFGSAVYSISDFVENP
jgi:hypothetical protein